MRRLDPSPLALEAMLEDAIERDSSILGLDLLVVGRQVATSFGKRVDLLGLDDEGDLHVIELKKDRTPREVVAQALEYGAWAKDLGYEEISTIFTEYAKGQRLEEAFAERFGQQPPVALNEQHRLIIVASELDGATERILTYLAEYGLPANAVFFRHFADEGRTYLARSWLIEPAVAEARAEQARPTRAREPWNGQDFYVAVGGDEHRSWEDMRRYEFISAGGAKWYWRTLANLAPGARVFAHIPQTGYVGVGVVEESARIVGDVKIEQNGHLVPLLDLDLKVPKMRETAHDAELAERVVKVKWIKTLPREQAVWERGMYANQNSATAMRHRFTVEKLVQAFGLEAQP